MAQVPATMVKGTRSRVHEPTCPAHLAEPELLSATCYQKASNHEDRAVRWELGEGSPRVRAGAQGGTRSHLLKA